MGKQLSLSEAVSIEEESALRALDEKRVHVAGLTDQVYARIQLLNLEPRCSKHRESSFICVITIG